MSKREVCGVNIRISKDFDRDYVGLLSGLYSLKRGFKVRGSTYLAISSFDPETQEGVFSKYTEIDVDGDWFNTEAFADASDDDLSKVSFPEEIKPNHTKFHFSFDTDTHVLVFESYNNPDGLSYMAVAKYLEKALKTSVIKHRFGIVETDIIQDFMSVKRLIELPNIREITFVMRRPNPDDFNGDLRSVIEERLRDQNADELTETFKSKRDGGIQASQRTRKLGDIAAQTGHVKVKNVENGVVMPHSTMHTPLRESDKFDADEGTINPFRILKNRLLNKVVRSRDGIRDTEE